MRLLLEEVLLKSKEGFVGFERERSKVLESILLANDDDDESKALFQNPKSISSSLLVVVLFQLLFVVDVVFGFGGLICKDKSGCAGNSSISSFCYLHLPQNFFFFFVILSC